MSTEKKLARRKLSLLELASDLGNVSKACWIIGYSRQQFYEIRRNYQVHGAAGLVDRLPGPKGPHPNRVPEEVEKAVLDHSLAYPTHGCLRVAEELTLRGLQLSSGGVRGVWSGHNLLSRHERLLRLELAVSREKIELKPEQIRLLERLHRTLLDEHLRIKGRQKWYESVEEMQKDLGEYLVVYNTKRPHQGRGMNGRTPIKAFMEGVNQKDRTGGKSTKKAA